MGRLTPKNIDFLDLYRTDPEYRQAENYMAVYTSIKNEKTARAAACRLLARPEAQEYLAAKAAKAQEKLDLKEEDILRDLMELRDMCMGRTEVPYVKINKDGVHEGMALEFNPQGAKGALELLGKNKRMFTDKIDHTGNVQHVEYNFNLSGKKVANEG